MFWSQNYSPVGGSIGLSALVAALPVVTVLALLAFWHVRAHVAALVGLLLAGVIAVGVYGMPATMAAAAAGYGAAFGLFPIGWIVLNALFIYGISVETGGFKDIDYSYANGVPNTSWGGDQQSAYKWRFTNWKTAYSRDCQKI